jgi:hypothetical protein
MKVSDILEEVKATLGKCSNDFAYARITEAVKLLANKNKGSWNPLIGYVDICTTPRDCQTVTLPYEVDVPMAINIGGYPKIFHNKWAEFHLNGLGSNSLSSDYWEDIGYFPCVDDIKDWGYLAAVSELKTDLGKNLRIYGRDRNGKTLRAQAADGTWSDGVPIPINYLSDYPGEVVIPDPERLQQRIFSVDEFNTFTSTTAHEFVTGAEVDLVLVSSPITPLETLTSYYVRVLNATQVKLYEKRSDALADTNAIGLDEATAASEFTLTDRRGIAVLTRFRTGVAHGFSTGILASLTGTTMPTPIVEDENYYVRVIDTTRFTLHETATDAANNANPIDVSDEGVNLTVKGKQDLLPKNYLEFEEEHNFVTGDLITAQNNTGTLPSPLVNGSSYYVRAISAKKVSLHVSLSDANSGENPIYCTTSGTGTSQLVKTIPCSVELGTTSNCTAIDHNLNLSGGDFIQFSTDGSFPAPLSSGTVYQADAPASTNTFTIADLTGTPINITTLGTGQLYLLLSRVFTVAFYHNWETDASKISTGDEANVDTSLTLPATNPSIDSTTTYFVRKEDDETISLFTTEAYATDTAVRTTASRARATNVATITTSAAHGLSTGDYVDTSNIAISLDGVLDTVTVTAGGAGYTNDDGATLTDAGGHTARGTLTVAAGAITAITVTDGGSGFTVAGALTITPDAAGAGATATVGSVNNGVANTDNTYNQDRAQITVTGATTFTYASNGLDEPTTADTGGSVVISPIKVLSFGVGELRLVLSRSVVAEIASSSVRIDSIGYLTEGATGRFETTGTLPVPLVTGTDYKVAIDTDTGYVSFKDTGGHPVTLLTIGEGLHNFVIAKTFNVSLGTNVTCALNEYTDGDAVTLTTSDTIPAPLTTGTTYYLRRIDDNSVEIYDTEAHAKDTSSTTGRIEPTSRGEGIHYFNQFLPNWEISDISHIIKDTTNGVLSVYCFDYGRLLDLTVLGYFKPNETEPRYRRIRIAQTCDWIRMRYKRNTFKITSSDDFIPLENPTAVLFMVRAINLMKNNFVEEGQKYERLAEKYLKEEKSCQDGPDTFSLQVNDEVYGSGEDVVT